ncbi:undecaprenyldiphospho-muramoylpentapeptide beta-N-acetylglucosaminyltransferase [Parvibium lacunae]|uniref:UDP-N-acetylglucosamine--N-acetylmuramyl-(pentapeptide) pyrophosphoryl-undecaprenol N-acetylglucosamine transferase n=1 Tax=Parvibium lacunae TaxID=1888893 RepID=A0A368L1X3_9BURK|nr:undecaprenyldiphospho-muramoylpentapeptide beta-N-acetylglucosaminyltransferase [Parvibium lacunae]RCS57556.1 undecaprenyldiphospho-muramoylpentapeptide beta-N-acetylglucosaminyltransferase [Parvibium lacunae]
MGIKRDLPINSRSRQQRPQRLLVMAGGTGGHIFPGLAVAKYLQAQGWEVHWLGAPASMESRVVPQHGIEIELVAFGGVRGKGWVTRLLAPWRLARACWQARKVLRRVQPDVVLGMGGYITVPGGIAARWLGYPLVLHEQNSIAGLSNRLLARLAQHVLVAFPQALPNAIWTGNPVGAALTQVLPPAERMAERAGPLRLLVVGGSLGAAALNTLIPQALALLPAAQRPTVLHQAGEKHLQTLQENYAAVGVAAETVAFIDDMAQAYAQADLVICRAGAMTIAELAVVGVASILVPFPYAVDDHQTHNAEFLAAQGAAWLAPQATLSPAWLAERLAQLTRTSLMQMACCARALGKPEAVEQVAGYCLAAASPS